MKHVHQKIRPMRSPIWARGGHRQTLLGHFLPSPQLNEGGERILLDVSGGDQVVAYRIDGEPGSRDVSIYLFHGLGGDSQSSYMQRTAHLSRRYAQNVYLFNHRGCGADSPSANEPYHSGRAEDLSALISEGRRRNPNHFHLAVGFSLSGNALLLLAAGERARVLPDAAISVNAPINLHRCSALLGRGMNRIYDFRFMRDMRSHVGQAQRFPLGMKLSEFDESYTAPRSGFKNADEYYSVCSGKRYLHQIRIPTVMLTAADDPFVDVSDYMDVKPSKSVFLHIEEVGGHMGYLSVRDSAFGFRWLDYALDSYIRGIICR